MNEFSVLMELVKTGGVGVISVILVLLLRRADANSVRQEQRYDALLQKFEVGQDRLADAFRTTIADVSMKITTYETGVRAESAARVQHQDKEEEWFQHIRDRLTELGSFQKWDGRDRRSMP